MLWVLRKETSVVIFIVVNASSEDTQVRLWLLLHALWYSGTIILFGRYRRSQACKEKRLGWGAPWQVWLLLLLPNLNHGEILILVALFDPSCFQSSFDWAARERYILELVMPRETPHTLQSSASSNQFRIYQLQLRRFWFVGYVISFACDNEYLRSSVWL